MLTYSLQSRVQSTPVIGKKSRWRHCGETQGQVQQGQQGGHRHPGQFLLQLCHVGVMFYVVYKYWYFCSLYAKTRRWSLASRTISPPSSVPPLTRARGTSTRWPSSLPRIPAHRREPWPRNMRAGAISTPDDGGCKSFLCKVKLCKTFLGREDGESSFIIFNSSI